MNRRPWILAPKTIAAMLAALATYCILAENFGFDIAGPPSTSQSMLDHCLWECLPLWYLLCLAVILVSFACGRRPPRRAQIWPIITVPFLMAMWLTGSAAIAAYHEHVERAARRIPSVSFWFDIGMPLVPVALPVIAWLAILASLVPIALIWRRPTDPGFCPACQYDLTGNTSGVCPECGTPLSPT